MKQKSQIILTAVAAMLTSCINGGSLNYEYKATYGEAIQAAADAAVTGFNKVEINGGMHVYFITDSVTSIRFEGDTADIARIETKTADGRLTLTNHSGLNRNVKTVKVYLASPALSGVSIAGSGSMHVNDTLAVNKFNIDIAGSGSVSIVSLAAKSLSASIAGSGNITARQIESDETDVSVAGSGGFSADMFKTAYFKTSIAGSGDVSLNNADVDEAKLSIAGSGDISVSGRVGRYTESVKGSGKVNVKNK